jgi:hypothetical protein
MGDDPFGVPRTDRAGKLSLLKSALPLFKDVTAIFTAVFINRHCPTPLCIRASLKLPGLTLTKYVNTRDAGIEHNEAVFFVQKNRL